VTAVTATTTHRVRWYARHPGHPQDWTPRTRNMVGGGWAWDVECTCGWASRTGGALQGYLRTVVEDHKWEVEFVNDPTTDPRMATVLRATWTGARTDERRAADDATRTAYEETL
jgi:hypothetical protein